ncbi:elongation factor P hydroxylase [Pseudidiomarina halophila]|uniref:Transporting ATPase n=1 Tax=Pseudidiomarina halophila TaxID=1449799 RepID=A0A432Y003_9GAMM|nr:elongation factor P hydroxylase [Pseudidiomarina halophila]RUO54281.1 transporting ATPase [Pseudidiomarina halophila]
MSHADYQTLIKLFDDCFYADYRTRLVAGDDEPLYRAASTPAADHEIVFAHGFFASALHEIAHWCIAGPARRQLEDYGYWYEPDGRDAAQQAQFEQVERKPQALEWLFSLCAGVPFQVSVDNLNGASVDRQAFTAAVQQQLVTYLTEGLPPRAERFARALAQTYQQPWPSARQLLNYQGVA